jgi:acetyl-CoA carboxylase biotin carboxyl carrier protein
MSITFSDADEILRIIDRFPAAEIRFEHGDLKLYIKRTPLELLQRAASVTPVSTGGAPTAPVSAPERPISPSVAVHPPPSAHAASHVSSIGVNRAGQIPIESPLMGVFYAAPSPEAPPFVTVGQMVVKGTELCIIEVMKVMNLIKAPVDGKISDIVAANGSTVEVGQALMWISPLEKAT